LDLWVDSYANYPPTNADSITASAKPALSSATKNTSTAISTWTAGGTIAAGSIIAVEVESVTGCLKVQILLECR
jgi:hypothetical protein